MDAEDTAAAEHEMTTLFLVRELQRAGDDEQWSALGDKIDAALVKTAQSRPLPPGFEADDLRQIVLAKLAFGLSKVEMRSRGEFWGYVRTMASNVMSDLWRHYGAARREGGLGPGAIQRPAHEGELVDEGDDSASVLARVAEVEALERDCVELLPVVEHREIYLRRRRGEGYAMIAEAVGRNRAATVKVIYCRARGHVLECLRRRLDGYTTMLQP